MTVAEQVQERRPEGGTGSPRGSAVILGARNLGATIARELLADETPVASVARTSAELKKLEEVGAFTVAADASEPEELQRALRGAEQALGPIGLIVNAVSAVRPPSDGDGFG